MRSETCRQNRGQRVGYRRQTAVSHDCHKHHLFMPPPPPAISIQCAIQQWWDCPSRGGSGSAGGEGGTDRVGLVDGFAGGLDELRHRLDDCRAEVVDEALVWGTPLPGSGMPVCATAQLGWLAVSSSAMKRLSHPSKLYAFVSRRQLHKDHRAKTQRLVARELGPDV